MSLTIPLNLHTPEQIEAVLFELDTYIGLRRRAATKQRAKVTTAATVAPVTWPPELEAVIGSPEVAARLTVAELENCSDQIKTWRQFPVVHLILPARPTGQLKTDLVKWFRDQISPQILVKFGVNSSTIGGMVLRTPTRIRDFSFRRRLLGNQKLIPEILKRG